MPDRLVHLDNGDLRLVEDGPPDAPAMVLLSNAAASTFCWDPVIPLLARTFRVLRVDLLRPGRSGPADHGTGIPTQAQWVGAALDRLGARRAIVVGHSSGCAVATALAEQRPAGVAAVALFDFGPGPDAKIPEPWLLQLSLTRVPGRLLWRLRTRDTVRKSARTGFSRPLDIPDAWVDHVMAMTHEQVVGAMHAPLDYIRQRDLAARLRPLGLPVLVVFGADDRRWRAEAASAYRAVPGARVEVLPGVGHTPMMEDPHATGRLLLDLATATAGHPS